MRLRVLELAEYAAFTDDKKLIVNGVYTSIHDSTRMVRDQ